jgi:hypothetical protein
LAFQGLKILSYWKWVFIPGVSKQQPAGQIWPSLFCMVQTKNGFYIFKRL